MEIAIKVKSVDEQGKNFVCGCQEKRYWCANHDIYGVDAKYAPWGRGTTIIYKQEGAIPRESDKESFYEEPPDDYDGPTSCSCHINPPCSKCCPV
jgi:hypothetical protein